MGSDMVSRLVHPEDQIKFSDGGTRWEHAKDGQIFEGEYRIKSAREEYRWLLPAMSFSNAMRQGESFNFSVQAQDVTERKQTESARQQAELDLAQVNDATVCWQITRRI